MAPKAPCRLFQFGRCRDESKCRYAHVFDPNFKRKPCQQFAKGKCRKGTSCPYSHAKEGIQAMKNAPDHADATTEAKFKDWRYNIPRDTRKARALGPTANTFWKDALELISGDAGLMQEVITLLASEGGMTRVAELLDQPFENMNEAQLARLFTNQLLPFFQAITQKDVNASAILEDRVMTIYTYVFGPSGRRGSRLFETVVKHLSSLSLTNGEDLSLDESVTVSYEASVKALSRLVEINTTAQVVEAFQPIVETLTALVPDTLPHFATRTISRHLSRLQQRLSLGIALPSHQSKPVVKSGRATFELAKDLPGELSEEGPRHDNDKVFIRDISILPTQQEIQSSRTEYLPLSSPAEWHLGGLEGLLDRNFRLLREDTIGQLRDAAKFELERLQHPPNPNNHLRRRQGARTNVYDNIVIENVVFDAHRGLEFAIGFDQPRHLSGQNQRVRKDWWQFSKRLGADSLICLLGAEGSTKFLVVSPEPFTTNSHDKENKTIQLHKEYTLWTDSYRAHVVARLVNEEDIRAVLHGALTNTEHALSLVEFPGVLLPAFMPTLKAMQRMSDSLDVPFVDILAPVATPTNPERDVEVGPPAYATRPGFHFDLAGITQDGANITCTPGGNIKQAAQDLERASSLDGAQSVALVSALSRNLALIQGPPGTGKSYTGVEIIRALLANKSAANLGPILCVTFTNHALDQGMERLLDEGVSQLVRIGGRSKSDRLAEVNLREVAYREELTKTEKQDRWAAMKKMEEETKEMNIILNALSNMANQKTIESHLKNLYPDQYQQLFGGVDEDGFETVNYHQDEVMKRWLRDGVRGVDQARSIAELLNIHVNNMSQRERRALYQHWRAEMEETAADRFAIALASYNEAKKTEDRIKTERNLRVLRRANIIGVTTSGLAKSLDLLSRINVKVLLCEEAGEVLEAHLLTALLPSVEHAILIGDHQQLRPHVQNYDLSVEKRGGNQYELDISLFERLVRPSDMLATPIPFCTLQVQRRMHPSISQLIRQTLYPHLEDAETVALYPSVSGFKHRLFWMHHEIPEDGSAELHSTSHTNAFECEMVQAMVSHLVKQGVYRSKDIAVITPYLGQLRQIRNRLSNIFEIVLNERDEEELVKEGDDEPNVGSALIPERRRNVAQGTLLQALRIATVDNFQGEEAKVVIVSLVRSNINNNPGFLRTSNRINVLLSRAQHGMYVLGNIHTIRHIPMWADVIKMLDDNGNLGETLELRCPRHENIPMTVRQPEDFHRLAPEAGCQLPCDKMLECGHACIAKCHSEMLHNAVFCTKPCTRPKEGCEHNCPKPCGAICDKECQIIIDNVRVVPNCGHEKTVLPCIQYRDPSKIICETLKQVKVPGCGHDVTIPCYLDVNDPNYVCKETCGAALACGHTCTKPCCQCEPRDEEGAIATPNHGKCKKVCDRNYATCKHRCRATCHGDDPCPLCEAKCDVKCSHSACNKKCHEPCAPCAEEICSSHCPHAACSMPCAAPCDRLPCAQRCTELLECGCQCPSVCGEVCPDPKFCQNCATEDVKSLKADLILFQAYEEVDLDEDPCIFTECGHIFTLSSLDGTMEMGQHYDYDELTGECTAIRPSTDIFSAEELKTCPECRGSLRNISRYGRIVRRSLLDQSTKKLTAWSNRTRQTLSERLLIDQEHLLDSVSKARKPKQDVALTGLPAAQLSAVQALRTGPRYRAVVATRKAIQKFADRLAREEQPYQRVRDLVETRRRQRDQQNLQAFDFNIKELQLQEHLKAEILLIRCDMIVLTDIISMYVNSMQADGSHNKGSIEIGFAVHREQCEKVIKEAESSLNAREAVEGRIIWAKLAAMECGISHETTPSDVSVTPQNADTLKETASQYLDIAQAGCAQLKIATDSLEDEIDEVRNMLRDGLSTSEMRMIVAAMAGELRGTGHYYRCVNGHLFTVDRCGMPMEFARCPACGETVGGEDHRAVEGVTLARDIDEQFGALALE